MKVKGVPSLVVLGAELLYADGEEVESASTAFEFLSQVSLLAWIDSVVRPIPLLPLELQHRNANVQRFVPRRDSFHQTRTAEVLVCLPLDASGIGIGT